MLLWHTLATYFRRKYGVRVQKIPLDAGATWADANATMSNAVVHEHLVTAPAWPAHPEWIAAFAKLMGTVITH